MSWDNFAPFTVASGATAFIPSLFAELTKTRGMHISVIESDRGFVYCASFGVQLTDVMRMELIDNRPQDEFNNVEKTLGVMGTGFYFPLPGSYAHTLYSSALTKFHQNNDNWHWLLDFEPPDSLRGAEGKPCVPGSCFSPSEIDGSVLCPFSEMSVLDRLFVSLLSIGNSELVHRKPDSFRKFYEMDVTQKQVGNTSRKNRVSTMKKMRNNSGSVFVPPVAREGTYKQVLYRAAADDRRDICVNSRDMLRDQPVVVRDPGIKGRECELATAVSSRKCMMEIGHALRMKKLANSSLSSREEEREHEMLRSSLPVSRSEVDKFNPLAAGDLLPVSCSSSSETSSFPPCGDDDWQRRFQTDVCVWLCEGVPVSQDVKMLNPVLPVQTTARGPCGLEQRALVPPQIRNRAQSRLPGPGA